MRSDSAPRHGAWRQGFVRPCTTGRAFSVVGAPSFRCRPTGGVVCVPVPLPTRDSRTTALSPHPPALRHPTFGAVPAAPPHRRCCAGCWRSPRFVPVAADMAVGCGRRSMTGRAVGALTAVAVAVLALAGAVRADDHGRYVVHSGLIMDAPCVVWPVW